MTAIEEMYTLFAKSVQKKLKSRIRGKIFVSFDLNTDELNIEVTNGDFNYIHTVPEATALMQDSNVSDISNEIWNAYRRKVNSIYFYYVKPESSQQSQV